MRVFHIISFKVVWEIEDGKYLSIYGFLPNYVKIKKFLKNVLTNIEACHIINSTKKNKTSSIGYK